MEVQNAAGNSLSRQGSGAVGAQAEYDMMSRDGFNTGRAGQGITLNWDDKSLGSIGIPGRIRRFQMSMSSVGEGDDGLSSFTDRKDFNTYISISPFDQIKNKWLSGLTFEYGHWFCNVDNRANDTGCERYRLRDHGDGARQTLVDTGAGSVGDGTTRGQGTGIVWSVGPYTARIAGYWLRSDEDRGATPGRKKGQSWLIGHDLFLWSPKGWLTGSSATAGSILVGTHFERNDVDCGVPCAGGEFSRNRVLLREWDLWYFIMPRMSVGISVLWYDASNLRVTANQAAHNLGICKTNELGTASCAPGKDGDWVDVHLNWRYTF
jgi:hypothetical protein